MKKLLIFSLLLSLFSCKSLFLEVALIRLGAFNKTANYSIYQKDDKSLIFFPIIHLAVEEQFDNLEFRLDSLWREGYYLYYESVDIDASDTINPIKLNKLSGLDLKNNNYKDLLDKFMKKSNSEAKKLKNAT